MSRSLLNPGFRHLAAFIFISFVLHVLWFIWFAMQGSAMFAHQETGGPGMGGGEDIVFQLSRGTGGGPEAEIPGSDMDLQDVVPETLAGEQVEIPLMEDETAIPVAPAENTDEKEKASVAATAAASAAKTAGEGGTKSREGGDGGDADVTRLARGGMVMKGPEITASAAGRVLKLIAGRLDIPSGNRMMNVKLNLFGDGTMRVSLTYFYYKTFHKPVTSTRQFKGDGKWWVEGDALCLQSMVIDYGTINCYEMNQRPGGELDLYYAKCTGRSSSNCRTARLGAQGHFSSTMD